jgi:hypothetical protein
MNRPSAEAVRRIRVEIGARVIKFLDTLGEPRL